MSDTPLSKGWKAATVIGTICAILVPACVAWGAASVTLDNKLDTSRFVADSTSRANDHELLLKIDQRTRVVCEMVEQNQPPQERAQDCQ